MVSEVEREKLAEAVRVALCRKDFGEYCKYVHGRGLYRHQEGWVKAWEEGERTLIVAPPGTYKALDMETPIPSPQGWRRFGDLRVGDEVFDESGKPSKVVWVSPVWKNRPCYEVIFSDHTSVIADEAHEWYTWSRKEYTAVRGWKRYHSRRECPPLGSVKTTAGIAARVRYSGGDMGHYAHQVPLPKAVEYPAKELPIPAYTLGAWLGDGHTADGRITNYDLGVWERIEADGFLLAPDNKGHHRTVYGLYPLLRGLGLLGHKFIPSVYLEAASGDRLALLQGLLDTDGSVQRTTGAVFVNTNKEIIDGILELARSLGIPACVNEYEAMLNGEVISPKWYVRFSATQEVFNLERKRVLLKRERPARRGKPIIEVRPVASRDTRCITVGNTSGLFIVGEGFTVTHNSTTVRMRIEWEIGINREGTHLLPMNTATQAQRQVMSVAETIERNERYRRVFPWVVANPKRGWSHEVLYVKREDEANPDATLYGTGWDGPYQGVHVDRIWPDDPTDQQDVMSPAVMEQQRARLHGVLIDRLKAGGKINGILTRWGENDLVRDFRGMGFCILENPIEGKYPWGRLLFPEKFGDDRLLEIRQGKGGEGPMSGQLYQLTYMCNPAAAEGAMLKREWWRVYSAVPEMERVIHSWDVSTGRVQGDYSAYQSWGRTTEGYYLLDAGRWRMGMDELIAKMKLLYEQSRPRPQYVLIEDAGVSIPVIDHIRSHSLLPFIAVKPGTIKKEVRVRAVQGLIEGGRVWVPAAAPYLEAFMDEMASFPGKYDDQIDAMAQALSWLDKESNGGDTFLMTRYDRVSEPRLRSRLRSGRVGALR